MEGLLRPGGGENLRKGTANKTSSFFRTAGTEYRLLLITLFRVLGFLDFKTQHILVELNHGCHVFDKKFISIQPRILSSCSSRMQKTLHQ